MINSGTQTTVLYSGGVGDVYSGNLANDIVTRSGGTIGSVDQTKMGEFLGGMFDHNDAGSLQKTYGKYLEFGNLDAEKIGDSIYESFRPTSAEFVKNIEGRVITITPQSNPTAVYGTNEVPEVIDGLGEGLESGRISHVNDIPAADFKVLDDIENIDARRSAYKEAFDQSFSDKIQEIRPDVYSYEDIDNYKNNKAALDIDTGDIKTMGAGPEASLSELDKSTYPTKVSGEEFAKSAQAARIAHVDRLKLPDEIRNAPERVEEATRARATPDRAPAALDDAALTESRARLSAADELGELRGFAATPDGSTSHLIDTKTSTIYTITGDDLTGVQKFDSSKEAGQAFGRMMGEAAQAHPEAFKGLPKVHSSLGALGNHIDDLGRAPWRKALGAFGEGAAEFGGKASKILGPLGVAAAGAEAYGLEMKLQDYEEFGLVPEEAMLAYRAILTTHTAQATVDPTLVGGEVAVQAAHDEWARAYGIDDNVKEALEPGSLLEDAGDAAQWLGDQAEAAGMAVRDYAISRWNDPGKLGEDWEAIKDLSLIHI